MKAAKKVPAMLPQDISIDVLKGKYAKGTEKTIDDIRERVADALSKAEGPGAPTWERVFMKAMENGFVPAGRIMSAIGSGINATCINCFVQPIGDAMVGYKDGVPSIMAACSEAAETLRRGGGVGYSFSSIRPRGGYVGGTHSSSSGPVSFMDIFDKMCTTIESAGYRRGAQLGSLIVYHPDIIEFIEAKRTKGRLNNFNVSVGVPDSFMQSLFNDEEIELVHAVRPHPKYIEEHPECYQRESDGMWVYRKVLATDIWAKIMRSTYDYAEPGILFLDRINQENNLGYMEYICTTNPCLTSDTWITTLDGPQQIKDLIDTPFTAIVNGKACDSDARGFFLTGTKPVLKLKTVEGYEVRVTGNHQIDKVVETTRYGQWTKETTVDMLIPGDQILLNDQRGFDGWEGAYTEDQGYLMGLLIGDGNIQPEGAIIGVWDENNGRIEAALKAFDSFDKRVDHLGFQKIKDRNEYRLKSSSLRDLAFELDAVPKNKTMSDLFERTSSDFQIGFLRGFFDTDGSVQGDQEKGVSVRLSQVNRDSLVRVQRMLARFGIASKIYDDRDGSKPDLRMLPDGKGGQASYLCQVLYELVISKSNLAVFNERIGFSDINKANKLNEVLLSYKRSMNREKFIVTVKSITSDGEEKVYDAQIPGVHHFDANGIYVHNCGEQPLPPYACCCLGSINLTLFVINPFTPQAEFVYEAFEKVVKTAIRMLDNVLDTTYWPLKEQKAEAMAKRRVGLGYLGLGDALIMLCQRYDSVSGREIAARITEIMRNSAYAASVELAKEKGAFPALDKEKYLESGFAKRLPSHIREDIRKHGIRNSHLLSIAPTGTITLAFADNASNGIEPAFLFSYNRYKLDDNGNKIKYPVLDHAYRLYHNLGLGTLDEDNQPKEPLPDYFVTAMSISALDHMRMMEVVQPFIDTSISKTVNIPEDYPFADFENLYVEAYKAGLKGLATYRPNDTLGAVLEAPKPKEELNNSIMDLIAPAEPDTNPLTVEFTSRPHGDLDAITRKMEYWTNDEGSKKIYLSVSFMKVAGRIDGKLVEVERPMEFFVPANRRDDTQQWVALSMRLLSQIARSGASIANALAEMREVVWDKGQVRYGQVQRETGQFSHMFHPSEVAALGYALQDMLFKKGFLDENGKQVSVFDLIDNQNPEIYLDDVDPNPGKTVESVMGDYVKQRELNHSLFVSQIRPGGKECPECHAMAMHKVDGCQKCDNCGYIGTCG